MIKLDKALNAWGKPDFEAVLKQEIAQLGSGQLPLMQGMSAGNYVPPQPVTATILNVAEQDAAIRVKAGIFFRSVIGGCSCADDPSPVDEIAEYCEVRLDIDKATAAATITLADE